MAVGGLAGAGGDPLKKLPLANGDLPDGFSLHGVRAGISSVPGKKDMALFLSDRPALAAGVFTTNLVKAAPVRYCQKKLAASPRARAVVINSGCANACTGRAGAADTAWTAASLARALGVRPGDILVASTGVIGRPLPRPALTRGVKALSQSAARKAGKTEDAVRAIMTTDTRPKAARASFQWAGKTHVMWGCAKGAGMIHPNMATLLSVVLTDAGLPAPLLKKALTATAKATFN